MIASNPEMSVRIADPKVLKPGQKIRCCLDSSDPMYETDGDGEETDDLDWYTAIIKEVRQDTDDTDVWNLKVQRPRERGDGHHYWAVVLFPDNLEYIRLLIKEWDD